MSLLRLPDEILLSIVSHLDCQDILSFSSVHAKTRDFYRESGCLRYLVELGKAGCWDPALFTEPAKDDPQSSSKTPIPKRLSYLQERERNWREMKLARNASTVDIPRNCSPIDLYDLSAGHFFCGKRGPGKGLEFIDLKEVSANQAPNSQGGNSTNCSWQHFHFEGVIRDFALSIHENDLIAIVNSDLQDDG